MAFDLLEAFISMPELHLLPHSHIMRFHAIWQWIKLTIRTVRSHCLKCLLLRTVWCLKYFLGRLFPNCSVRTCSVREKNDDWSNFFLRSIVVDVKGSKEISRTCSHQFSPIFILTNTNFFKIPLHDAKIRRSSNEHTAFWNLRLQSKRRKLI